MRPQPYIGISGVMSAAEIDAIMTALPRDPQRRLAFGVLTSAKTVHGIPNKYPNRYPRVDRLNEIFADRDSYNLYTLHYSADNDATLVADVELAMKAIGYGTNRHLCDGIQINMGDKSAPHISPDPAKVATIAAQYPCMRIILQVVPFEPASISSILHRIGQYAFCITDVLLDGSGGRGQGMFECPDNMERMRNLVLALRNAFPRLGIGIAGGLSAETLPRIGALLEEFPDLNLDAEGRLRNENDHLIVGAAVEYVASACRCVDGERGVGRPCKGYGCTNKASSTPSGSDSGGYCVSCQEHDAT